MLEVKPASVILDVPFNYPATFSFDTAFPLRRVRRAHAALKSFDLRFFTNDHPLQRIHVEVEDTLIFGPDDDCVRVSGLAHFQDTSESHTFYRVRLDFLVFADVIGSLSPLQPPVLRPKIVAKEETERITRSLPPRS